MQPFRAREERVNNELKLANFGEVATVLILSTPDPSNYAYYTELPG